MSRTREKDVLKNCSSPISYNSVGGGVDDDGDGGDDDDDDDDDADVDAM